MQNEPLLQDNKDRFVIFPVKHHDIWDFYQQLKKTFSTPFPEGPLRKDHPDWQNLSAPEKEFLLHFLNFFSGSITKMSSGLTLPLVTTIKTPEASTFLRLQLAMENLHSEATAEIVQGISSSPTQNLQKALQKQKKWMETVQKSNLAEKLIAVSVFKRIFSADLFLLKRELEKRQILPKFCFFLGRISDEIQIFSDFSRFLHDRHVVQQISNKKIIEIISEALLLEKQISAELPSIAAFGISAEEKDKFLNLLAEDFISGSEKSGSSPSEENEKTNIAEKRAGALTKSPKEQEQQQKSGPER